MTAGRHNDQDQSDALLSELWNNGYNVGYIAKVLGFAHESSVRHAARRLNLPMRENFRNIAKAQEANRLRLEAAALKKQVKLQESPIPGIEPPTCWVCGGRSTNWDGHDSCRGRTKAA